MSMPLKKTKIIKLIPSRERCSESDWYAWDIILSDPMDADFIQSLRGFGGSFLFLTQLKKPFFKIESDCYMIKGVETDPFFRMAVHDAHREELKRMERYLQ